MSLINDALKKAQKQRNNDGPAISAMPGVGGEPASHIARQSQQSNYGSLALWIGFGGIVLTIFVIGAFLVGRWVSTRPEAPAAAAPVVAQTAPKPAATVAPPVVTAPQVENSPAPAVPAPAVTTVAISAPTGTAPTPAPVFTPVATPPPVVAAAGSAATPVVSIAPSPAAVAPAQVAMEEKSVFTVEVAPTPAVEAPRPRVPGKLDPKALIYIDTLRVAGIRALATDAKVLMNDRVYRVGDTVEHILGLKLAAIAPNALTFEDERGVRFTRNF